MNTRIFMSVLTLRCRRFKCTVQPKLFSTMRYIHTNGYYTIPSNALRQVETMNGEVFLIDFFIAVSSVSILLSSVESVLKNSYFFAWPVVCSLSRCVEIGKNGCFVDSS